jgi:hypothetical protein
MDANPNPDPGQNVRRLLALKRYEQPPPGYFAGFAGRVMARIEAGEELEGQGWWSALLARLDLRPALVGAFGVAVCSCYFLGWTLAQRGVAAPFPALAAQMEEDLAAGEPPVVPLPVGLRRADPAQPGLAFVSSTHPVIGAPRPRTVYLPAMGHRSFEIERAAFTVR